MRAIKKQRLETLFGDVEYLINEIYFLAKIKVLNKYFSRKRYLLDLMKSIYLDLQRGKNLIQNVIPKQTKGISFLEINTLIMNIYKLNASIIDSLKAKI